ncbi:hypothetical protein Slin15195_G078690 [Septoria linicola]|uniref:Uncharacterized protein n=1 Tax=Septoria linicola TaxID=215465 RepID=A0A9Q9AXZ1_9PEZI|nr:hypothetical protein Slin14017_G039890 [Septoria linicola]USW54550.1 hypothetical protein Slin15195_G078690 [Septoria linicola]
MQFLFTVAFAGMALTTSALAIPEPPNIPTDVTNMIGGQKWLDNILQHRPFHYLRDRDAKAGAETEACRVNISRKDARLGMNSC